jgi:hypothetical protein
MYSQGHIILFSQVIFLNLPGNLKAAILLYTFGIAIQYPLPWLHVSRGQ